MKTDKAFLSFIRVDPRKSAAKNRRAMSRFRRGSNPMNADKAFPSFIRVNPGKSAAKKQRLLPS
ncbi:MAG: hypothetical protein LH470_11360 [Lysobacter sp.]|nr:hypothetical protein [Lysobacter sp.]